MTDLNLSSAAFLASAMAALGLDTDLVKVKSLGIKPILLAVALWANLVGMGFFVSRFLVGALLERAGAPSRPMQCWQARRRDCGNREHKERH